MMTMNAAEQKVHRQKKQRLVILATTALAIISMPCTFTTVLLWVSEIRFFNFHSFDIYTSKRKIF